MKTILKMIRALSGLSVIVLFWACSASAPQGSQEVSRNNETPLVTHEDPLGHDIQIQPPGPDAVSVYPPDIDPDQDNVINVAHEGHPETRVDNCPETYNPNQEDLDHDGVGDACQSYSQ